MNILACSSDETEEGTETEVPKKRIAKILCISKHDTGTTSFIYDSSGKISQISQKWSDEYDNISFYITGGAISWECEKRYVAELVDGKAINMTMEDCTFTYDSKGRLIEINTKGWKEIQKLTWEGDNIARIERYDYDGSFIEKIEYSYTNDKAYMLGYYFYFNPLTEFDFLDCIYEAALFYTGACGILSQNLPSSATFVNSSNEKGSRTYTYQIDSSGYPVNVTINGEGYDSDFYGYPVNMAVTWE